MLEIQYHFMEETMKRKNAIGISLILIAIGIIALTTSIFGALFNFSVWQLWPLFVICAGVLFVLPPALNRNKRGLGGLYIPGILILANGALLLFTSVFNWWSAWAWLWPLELFAAALAFAAAAFHLHVIWLMVPAIIIGSNGLLMQFCALTGWWGVWAVLWVIEPLSVAAALLAVNTQKHSPGLRTAGVSLLAVSAVGFMQSLLIVILSRIISVWGLWKWSSSIILILAGAALLVWGLYKPSQKAELAAE
jgi:hypothetical protein